MTDFSHIADNISRIKADIAAAADKAGRDPAGVRLIAVTKTYAAQEVIAAVEAGIHDAGENRIQEAVPKLLEVKDHLPNANLRWHLIGHLQRNKAKAAVEHFDLIHSLDSLRLAQEINRHAESTEKLMSVLMQINVSGEESKGGFDAHEPARVHESVHQILESCRHLTIKGLMTMAPLDDPEAARPVFKGLRELREAICSEIKHPRLQLDELSMGMSNDFKVAIEEGATMVRIGTAIFGKRN